jgi:tetratricopeptide (TPR) repeat protein
MADTSEFSVDRARLRAQKLFETGNEATLKNNHDYAIQMYREALKIDPDNLTFRQSLRGVERRRFNNDPSKVGKLVGARNQPIRMRASSARNKGRWLESIEHCEDAFVHNPWDHHAAMIAAEAAEGLEKPALARWFLESVAAQGLEDVHYLRHLAHAYELTQDFERAINCWEKVRKLAPSDDEAIKKIRGLQASATISRANLSDAIRRSGEQQADSAALPAEIEELKRQAMSPEERLRKQIGEEPTRVGLYLELADLLKRALKLEDAEKLLAQGIRANPDEELLREAYADVQISRLQRARMGWQKRLRDVPDDPDATSKMAQLDTMLLDYQIKEHRRRAQIRPDDLHNRFALGQALARASRWDEAIAEYQKARNDPGLRVQALLQTGIVFERKALPKLAERNLQEALKLIDSDDTALFNLLHYRLGRVAEAQSDFKAAEEHYNEVAANDFGYEDVARRLEALNRREEP